VNRKEQVLALIRLRMADARALRTDEEAVVRFLEHCEIYFRVLEESPVLILACYKAFPQHLESLVSQTFHDETGVSAWNPNLISLGMAVQNLLLAAHAAGLGACFHSGPVAFLRAGIHEILHLPRRLELAGVITVGWPVDLVSAGKRKHLDKILEFPGASDYVKQV